MRRVPLHSVHDLAIGRRLVHHFFCVLRGTVGGPRRHNDGTTFPLSVSFLMIDPDRLVRLIDDHAAALELYAAQWSVSPADVVQDALIRLAEQSPLPAHRSVAVPCGAEWSDQCGKVGKPTESARMECGEENRPVVRIRSGCAARFADRDGIAERTAGRVPGSAGGPHLGGIVIRGNRRVDRCVVQHGSPAI